MPEPDSKQNQTLAQQNAVTGTLERVTQLILNRRNVVYGLPFPLSSLELSDFTLMKSRVIWWTI